MSKVQVCEKSEIASIRSIVLGADSAINWHIVAVVDEYGKVGLGEATLEKFNAAVGRVVATRSSELLGGDVRSALDLLEAARPAETLVEGAAVSGLNQALWDLAARQQGLPLAVLVAGSGAEAPSVYANINRAIVDDRSPGAFVSIARLAQEGGFGAIKIAPFDDVDRQTPLTGANGRAFEVGLERIAAVRASTDVDVMVDLHWRFEGQAAAEAVAELGQFKPAWIEAPVQEHDLDGWRRVRKATDLPLAGAETLTHPLAFEEFMKTTGVDIVMPDIKYCGGVDGFRHILTDASRLGVQVSPHNPSGPVATLATIHAAAGMALHSLEIAWRASRVPLDVVVDGAVRLPSGNGLGMTLRDGVAAEFPAHEEPNFAPTDLI